MGKLAFVYLYYTQSATLGYQPQLLGCFRSRAAALSHLALVNGETVPCNGACRIAQKINNTTGQIWYVERHVAKDAV